MYSNQHFTLPLHGLATRRKHGLTQRASKQNDAYNIKAQTNAWSMRGALDC